MAEIFVIDVNENISNAGLQLLLNAVSDSKREKINRFYYEKDARRALYADTLVRYLAYTRLGMENKYISFNCNEYGKPYLQGVPEKFFNVSHSGQYVICGWSDDEIGVDVEEIKKIDLDIAKRFFTAGEYEYIVSDMERRPQHFYDVWTVKESYIKYKGKGLSIPLNSFEIKFSNELVQIKSNDKIPPSVFMLAFDNNYKMAVCTGDSCIAGLSAVSLEAVCQVLD